MSNCRSNCPLPLAAYRLKFKSRFLIPVYGRPLRSLQFWLIASFSIFVSAPLSYAHADNFSNPQWSGIAFVCDDGVGYVSVVPLGTNPDYQSALTEKVGALNAC